MEAKRKTRKERLAEQALVQAACAFVDCKAGNGAFPFYERMYRARKALKLARRKQ